MGTNSMAVQMTKLSVRGHALSTTRRLASLFLDRIELRRTIRTPYGSYKGFVSPRAHLQVIDPRGVRVDSEHLTFIDAYVNETDVVWDIGGSLGLFAFPAALKASRGRVFSFEPDIEMARLMQDTVRSNPTLSHVTVVSCAVYDEDKLSPFLISRYGRSMNKIAAERPWQDAAEFRAKETRLVATLTIDTLSKCIPRPNVLKIDAEGSEYRILLGGAHTISEFRPKMLIEVASEVSLEIGMFLKERQYRILDANASLQEVGAPPWNTVAIPQ